METEPLVIDTISENETPAVDTPAVDTPAVDTPAVDTPANEENQDQTQNQTIKLTLIQLLERVLQDNEKVKMTNWTLTTDMKSFIQTLLEKEPQLFATCETSLQKIISDNKINANDIPDLMVLITIIFNAIDSFDKKDLKNVDYYELVKNILHIIIELYVEKHCDNNNENNVLLVQCALRIVDSSIELIKLRGFAKETTMIKKIISMCKKCSCKK